MRARKKSFVVTSKTKFLMGIVAVLSIIAIFFYMLDYAIRPVIYQFAETQTRLMAVLAINQAVTQQNIELANEYANITKINYDANGKIIGITVDATVTNVLKEQLLLSVNEKLVEMQNQKISVPLGTILNWTLLNGYGPKINLRIIPLSYATADIVSQLESAGLNQSMHKINIVVKVDMCALIPGYSKSTTIKNEVLLSQTIIVGEVPQVKLNN